VSQKFFHPVFTIGQNIGGKFKSFGAYFVSKSYLYEQKHHYPKLKDLAILKLPFVDKKILFLPFDIKNHEIVRIMNRIDSATYE